MIGLVFFFYSTDANRHIQFRWRLPRNLIYSILGQTITYTVIAPEILWTRLRRNGPARGRAYYAAVY